MNKELFRIYTEICKCHSEICSDVFNCLREGSPPRGFYTESSGPVKILVVGKNPGHVLESERAIYIDKNASQIVEEHLNLTKKVFFRGNTEISSLEKRSTQFHNNLMSYLSYFLDVSSKEVFKHVAYTNLVKCSTSNEQAKLTKPTQDECFNRHLNKELNFFKPECILALGREVESYLLNAYKNGIHNYPVLYIKHPSYHYKKDQKDDILSEIKYQFLKTLKTKN